VFWGGTVAPIDLSSADFAVITSMTEDTIRLDWRGRRKGDTAIETLAPLFERVLAAAASGGRRVEMCFDDLQELDADTLTELLLFTQRFEGTDITLTIVYDPTVKWQRLSFEPLRAFIDAGAKMELKQRFKSDRFRH
jgi:hypothetical protein